MRCIAISAEKDDRCSLYAIQDTLNDFLNSFRQRHEEVQNACAFRYHDALLVFVSYAIDEQHGDIFHDLENAIRGVGVNYYGVGDLVPLGEADISIRQATILLNEAHLRGTRRLEWSDLSMDAFSYAAQTNPMFERTARGFRSRIEKYDAQNSTELVQTARAFVHCSGDIVDTAKHLHQHPNTVRYRLRRIRTLLDMSDSRDRELLVFLSLAFLNR